MSDLSRVGAHQQIRRSAGFCRSRRDLVGQSLARLVVSIRRVSADHRRASGSSGICTWRLARADARDTGGVRLGAAGQAQLRRLPRHHRAHPAPRCCRRKVASRVVPKAPRRVTFVQAPAVDRGPHARIPGLRRTYRCRARSTARLSADVAGRTRAGRQQRREHRQTDGGEQWMCELPQRRRIRRRTIAEHRRDQFCPHRGTIDVPVLPPLDAESTAHLAGNGDAAIFQRFEGTVPLLRRERRSTGPGALGVHAARTNMPAPQ